MIQFCVRLMGRRGTKIIASTTPKPKPLIMNLLDRDGEDVVVTRASTYVNIANLAPAFQKQILQYEGTKLGDQEIHAQLIDPESGGIVKRDWFRLWPDGKAYPKLEYIIQSSITATSLIWAGRIGRSNSWMFTTDLMPVSWSASKVMKRTALTSEAFQPLWCTSSSAMEWLMRAPG